MRKYPIVFSKTEARIKRKWRERVSWFEAKSLCVVVLLTIKRDRWQSTLQGRVVREYYYLSVLVVDSTTGYVTLLLRIDMR